MSTMNRHGATVLAAGVVLAAITMWAHAAAAGAADAKGALVERGRVLMNGIVACGNCHTPQGPDGPVAGMELAGAGPMKDAAFTVYPPNLTPDPETGLGRWTDAQIVAAIRDGVRPDGSLIGPPMPIHFYRHMADEDAAALVAYLRSIPAVKNAVPKSEYRMPLPASWGPPVGAVPAAARDDRVAYGAYLATALGHCMDCHTPRLPNGAPDMERLGVGGMAFPGPWGVTVSANLTPDREHGLGGWSDRQIKDAIARGVHPDGRRLNPPMAFAWYANIPEADLDALVAYLRSLKPQH
ncbi:c-type cytochrome [Azospirillum sp. ST 5-10]|uniref:c-type cytochrome n=1 Tax=unclassified Azospirillum TaxID=2630922 RepID=UPI003F4A1702